MKALIGLIIVVLKILLTKGLSLIFLLLSFALKGKILCRDKIEWNDYFAQLSESFAIKYAIYIYMIATILSSLMLYILFLLFEFQSPLLLTVILFAVCIFFSWIKYRVKGKKEIIQAVYKIHQSAILNKEKRDIN